MKKTMSIFLALLLCMNLAVIAFAADTCFVAGTAKLCGSEWQASDPSNAMTLNGTVYEKVYSNVPVGDYEFKVVYNGQWKNIGGGEANVMFSVVSPCDVTITYDPATDTVAYSGTGIGERAFQVNGIYVAGAKSDAAPGWLHGEDWNAGAAVNQAVSVGEDLYSISFEDIPAGTYEFKFAADLDWTHNWGGTFTEFGVPTDAAYKGANISFTLTEQAKVTLKLDLSNFAIATGGAKFTVALNEEDTPPVIDPPVVQEPSYYVAGCKELCGSDWKENDPQNKMTKGSDGIYTKEYKNVPAGSYALKVTDGTWTNSWGGDGENGNYAFTTTKAGDITVEFRADTKQVSVKTPSDPKPVPQPSGEKYYVSGNCAALGDWAAAPAHCLMDNKGDGEHRIIFKNLPAGNYEFKVTNGTWEKSWGENGDNKKLTLDKASSVTVIFRINNDQGSIQVEIGSPRTADLGMLPVLAAALCATMGACLLVMNKKKLI